MCLQENGGTPRIHSGLVQHPSQAPKAKGAQVLYRKWCIYVDITLWTLKSPIDYSKYQISVKAI